MRRKQLLNVGTAVTADVRYCWLIETNKQNAPGSLVKRFGSGPGAVSAAADKVREELRWFRGVRRLRSVSGQPPAPRPCARPGPAEASGLCLGLCRTLLRFHFFLACSEPWSWKEKNGPVPPQARPGRAATGPEPHAEPLSFLAGPVGLASNPAWASLLTLPVPAGRALTGPGAQHRMGLAGRPRSVRARLAAGPAQPPAWPGLRCRGSGGDALFASRAAPFASRAPRAALCPNQRCRGEAGGEGAASVDGPEGLRSGRTERHKGRGKRGHGEAAVWYREARREPGLRTNTAGNRGESPAAVAGCARRALSGSGPRQGWSCRAQPGLCHCRGRPGLPCMPPAWGGGAHHLPGCWCSPRQRARPPGNRYRAARHRARVSRRSCASPLGSPGDVQGPSVPDSGTRDGRG
ncbi:collagen alpha-2(I) chain-like [Melospiza melodia melodia]|uniref:collagen alpha-2(I) chain-like n=1 Tax=Melospiza melodia melodia TaxID=1914991 RepID=UPI002FD1BA63